MAANGAPSTARPATPQPVGLARPARSFLHVGLGRGRHLPGGACWMPLRAAPPPAAGQWSPSTCLRVSVSDGPQQKHMLLPGSKQEMLEQSCPPRENPTLFFPRFFYRGLVAQNWETWRWWWGLGLHHLLGWGCILDQRSAEELDSRNSSRILVFLGRRSALPSVFEVEKSFPSPGHRFLLAVVPVVCTNGRGGGPRKRVRALPGRRA
ncbi:uncharacterized protein LOC110350596 [Heterocephalus glaber]|uniref:Uncharacterized protein LOC110350596 n=1 Tax=Heterocephalus glaber TaxID=10181 RepID=A0AAX6TD13_HETGA|nr:uncharacterized protein LOC110350596 [Heterocephalus glaber]